MPLRNPDSIIIPTTTIVGGTVGSVLFVGTGPVIQQDNANFFWDDTNNRLGLGGASPSAGLHVISTTAIALIADNAAQAVDIFQAKDNGTTKVSIIDGGDFKLASAVNIVDANSNELIKFTQTASAVNEITIGNNSTGANATITASGETNTGITITGKGTKGVTVGNALIPTQVTLTDGATPALDASLGNQFILVAAGDRTIAVPTNPAVGQKIVIRHNASGGARTLALNTGAGGFRYGSDITGLTQTASGKTDYIGCIWNSTDSFFDVVAYVKGF